MTPPAPPPPTRPRDGRARRTPTTLAAGACAALVMAQLVLLGANTSLLAATFVAPQCLLAAAMIVAFRPNGQFWRKQAGILAIFAGMLAWMVAGQFARTHGLAPGPAPDLFALEFVKQIGAVALFVAGALLGSRRGVPRRFLGLLVAFGVAYTLFALALRNIDPTHVYGIEKGREGARFTATMLNANAAGCVFAVVAVAGVGYVLRVVRDAYWSSWPTRSLVVAGGATVAAVLALAATALTGSRAALAGALVASALLILPPAGRRAGGAAASRRTLVVAVGVGLLVLLVLLPDVFRVTTDRFGTVGGDGIDRLRAVRHYAALTLGSPWFGYGAGSFPILNANTMPAQYVDMLWNFGAAHNAPVQAALDAGWPYVALGVAGWAHAAVRLRRAWRRRAPDAVIRAPVLAVLVILGCAVVDITISVPAVLSLLALLSGVVLGWAGRVADGSPAALPPPEA